MPVAVREFLRTIGKQPPPATVLFAPGKPPFNKEDFEPYLVDRAVEKLVDAYVDPNLRDLTFTVYYADETPPGVIAEEARTLPFLAERRVILVRNADRYMSMSGEKNSPLQPLLAGIENPSSSTLLILITAAVDKRKRLYKACDGAGVIVECPQLDDAELAAWIRQEMNERGRAIAAGAVSALIERVGGKMSDMANAINLVCNFVANNAPIAEEHVRAACADVAEATVWALTDAIAASQPTAALEALQELLALSKSPDEIIGTINWLLESAYRALPDTQPRNNSNYVERKVRPLADKFGRQKLIEALALCTKTQFSLRTTGADKTLMLEMMVIKLSSYGRNAATKCRPRG